MAMWVKAFVRVIEKGQLFSVYILFIYCCMFVLQVFL